MNIGIVVEGVSDEAAYPQLIRKVRNDVDVVLAKSCGSDSGLTKRFVGLLKYFHWHALSVDKALVIVDSDCSDSFAREAKLRRIYEESHFVASFPVHFHATRCELETWLLADENAINHVAQVRGKNTQVAAVTVQLEGYKDAKELFQKVLSDARLPADPQVYKEIAGFADVARIIARCPSFRLFAEKVLAC
jgi:hypothetical protein